MAGQSERSRLGEEWKMSFPVVVLSFYTRQLSLSKLFLYLYLLSTHIGQFGQLFLNKCSKKK